MKKLCTFLATLFITGSLLAIGPESNLNDCLPNDVPNEGMKINLAGTNSGTTANTSNDLSVTDLMGLTLSVSPSGRNVSPYSGTTTFNVSSIFSWGETDNVSWLNGVESGCCLINVSYSANPTPAIRTATITVTNGVETEKVLVVQGPTSFTATPSSRSVGSISGTTSFSVSSNVAWSVSDNASWLTATKTSDTNIGISYSTNTSTSPRTATITAITTTGASITLTVNQAGADPYIDVTPNSAGVSAASGSGSFSVSTNVGWSVSDDASWLTATKTNGSTISFNYEINYSTSFRTANITASGTGGVSETVTVTQAGADPYLNITPPDSRSVSSESGSTSFSVSANVTWDVSDDASWLTAVKDGNTISVSYDKNYSTSPRTANITATGGGITKIVTVTQAGAAPYLNITPPDSRSVSSESGSTSFSVSANVTWDVSDDASWLTALKDGNTISVSYEANTSTSPRSANIAVTGGGITRIVTVTQAGADPYLNVIPVSNSVSSASGSTSFNVSANVTWDVSDDASWLTALKDGNTISVGYEANTSTSPRTANITATGGGVSETVSVIQSGTDPYLDVSANSESVGSESGSVSFIVSSNVDWTVSDDATWLSASKDGNTISVSYEENTSSSPRTANITATGGGISETVTVTQEGKAIVYFIDISSNNKTVDCKSGSASVTVSSNVDWSVSSSENWLVAIKTDANTLTVNYDENASENERSASITISGEGISRFITIVQEGAAPTAVNNRIEDQKIIIYPNPASEKLFLKTESEIEGDMTIALFDISGNLIHSRVIFQPYTGEIISIDLSSFKSGIYFLRLNNLKTYKFEKL